MQYTRWVFVTGFLMLLYAPLLAFNFLGTTSASEKRDLEVLPKFSFPALLTPVFFKGVEKYIEDRIGFKSEMVYLYTVIQFSVLQKRANKKILVGKDRWLFYTDKEGGDNFSDFNKTNLFSESEALRIADRIQEVEYYFKKHGIKFLFVIAPNKHNIYPEFYPFKRPEGFTRTDQIVKHLDEKNVSYIYLRDYLIDKKSSNYPIYYETDTHWNDRGAYHASEIIREKIQNYFPGKKIHDVAYEFKIKNDYRGDLLNMLGYKKFRKATVIDVFVQGNSTEKYFQYLIKDDNDGGRVLTEGKDKSLPHAVIFRDSFFVSLEPFVSVLFSEADYHWRYYKDEDKKYILEKKPDIVIWEMIERNIPVVLN